MAKAFLLLDSDGVALAPATLWESAQETLRLDLPMLNRLLAELSAGTEIRASGESAYDLFEDGERVGRLEIFEAPASIAKETLV